MNRIVWLMVFMLLGIGQLFSQTGSVKTEEILIQRIEGVNHVVPTADGKHAWGWNDETSGIFIIDSNGAVLNRDTPLLKGIVIHKIVPSKSGDCAWVITNGEFERRNGREIELFKQIYFIDKCSKNAKPMILDLKIKSFQDLKEEYNSYELIPSGIPSKAWFTWFDENEKINYAILKGTKIIPLSYFPNRNPYRKTRHIRGVGPSKVWYIHLDGHYKENRSYPLQSIDIEGKFKLYPYSFKHYASDGSGERLIKIETNNFDTPWLLTKEQMKKGRNRWEGSNLTRLYSIRIGDKIEKIHEFRKYYLGEDVTLIPVKKNHAFLIDFDPFESVLESQFITPRISIFFIDTSKNPPVKEIEFLMQWNERGFYVSKVFDSDKEIVIEYGSGYMVFKYKNGPYLERLIGFPWSAERLANSFDGDSYWMQGREKSSGEWGTWRHSISKNEALSPLLFKGLNVETLNPYQSGQSGWVNAKIDNPYRTYRFNYTKDKKDFQVSVDFGTDRIDSSKKEFVLTYGYHLKTPKVKIQLPSIKIDERGIMEGRAELSIRRIGDQSGELIKGAVSLKNNDVIFFKKIPFAGTGRYNIKLNYTDDLGSNLTFAWNNVRVKYNPLKDPIFAAGVIGFAIIVISSFLLFSKVLLETYRGWAFISFLTFAWAGSAVPSVVEWFRKILPYNPLLLNILLLSYVSLLMLFGLIRPGIFRKLSRTKPFSAISRFALLLPHVSKKFYKDYILKLSHRLKNDRERARGETYCTIPAVGKHSSEQKAEQLNNPVSHIFNLLLKPGKDSRPVFLIEGVGGCGKSAMIREIIRRLLEHFDSRSFTPLPIYISEPEAGKTINQMIEGQLGDHAISSDYLEIQIERGDFIVFIDNLHEEKISTDTIHKYISNSMTNPSSLVSASRYHDKVHHTFNTYPNTYFVNPQPLDNDTLADFVNNYEPGYTLPEEIKASCRTTSGTYNSLLIRLALMNKDLENTSPAGIYRGALIALLERSGSQTDKLSPAEILKKTMQLCKNTYWKNGDRDIATKLNDTDLIPILQEAGILVPVKDDPQGNLLLVRFFHDTMQSFLTAWALAEDEEWQSLEQAAGHKFFQEDLDQTQPGNELFRMCLETFQPKNRLKRELTRIMQTWADNEAVDEVISKRVILNALPEETQESVRLQSRTDSPSQTLLHAIETSRENLQHLSHLFGRLAQEVYPVIKSDEDKQ